VHAGVNRGYDYVQIIVPKFDEIRRAYVCEIVYTASFKTPKLTERANHAIGVADVHACMRD